MAGRNRGPKYRRKLFVYFMAIAIVPLLILGIYSLPQRHEGRARQHTPVQRDRLNPGGGQG